MATTVSSARSTRMSLTTTVAPRAASTRAMPAPTFCPAPVTSATLPFRSNMVPSGVGVGLAVGERPHRGDAAVGVEGHGVGAGHGDLRLAEVDVDAELEGGLVGAHAHRSDAGHHRGDAEVADAGVELPQGVLADLLLRADGVLDPAVVGEQLDDAVGVAAGEVLHVAVTDRDDVGAISHVSLRRPGRRGCSCRRACPGSPG